MVGWYIFRLTKALAQLTHEELIIYSHSLDNAIMLSDHEKVSFNLLGGRFFPKNRFYYSLNETEILKSINFDIAFIGAAGLKNGKVSFDDQEDAYLKQLVLKNSQTKILLAEQDKFDKSASFILSDISIFDYFITDKKPKKKIRKNIAGNVKIIY
ncbi:DeoR C terminal sensor domain-containing protein [Halanaerobium salsuginis]|uniref:DeoR C terminal sensor domain-containing protein n=1 Tax=Halanaerobium salsuginis TaxID=29563 RepID=A0A1I4NBP5_9FIRM|nr:DeoR C terminal sensor domain-containing protein [Halanaerobium salsuginis]